MASHAEDALCCTCITQIFDLAFAVSTTEACGAKGLISGQNGEIFDFVVARVASICTIIAYERAVAEEQEVGVGVEEGAAGVAAEAVKVPSLASWRFWCQHRVD